MTEAATVLDWLYVIVVAGTIAVMLFASPVLIVVEQVRPPARAGALAPSPRPPRAMCSVHIQC